jgi:hypothetical protein
LRHDVGEVTSILARDASQRSGGKEMRDDDRGGATRREVLRGTTRLALVLPLTGLASSAWLSGCGSGDEPSSDTQVDPVDAKPAPPSPDPTPTPAPEPDPPVAGGAAGGGGLVTDLSASAPLVAALQYTNVSQKPDQDCAGCQLFTAGRGGLGKCQLFAQGAVTEGGWCASWAAKVS